MSPVKFYSYAGTQSCLLIGYILKRQGKSTLRAVFKTPHEIKNPQSLNFRNTHDWTVTRFHKDYSAY